MVLKQILRGSIDQHARALVEVLEAEHGKKRAFVAFFVELADWTDHWYTMPTITLLFFSVFTHF